MSVGPSPEKPQTRSNYLMRYTQPTNSSLEQVLRIAKYLIGKHNEISYFELHKFMYLIEYLHVKKYGRRLTPAYFIRQKDGPYCTDLEYDRLKRADQGINIKKMKSGLVFSLGANAAPKLFQESEEITDAAKAIVEEALQRYGDKNESELKTAVYLTAPMKYMLRREQATNVNLYNAPIEFLEAQ